MSLESDLAELRQRVDKLEGRPVADQLSPGVFSLNAQGKIEELLSGHLSAQGVDFVEQAAAFAPNSIRWLDEGGTLREIITGLRQAPNTTHVLNLEAQGTTGSASLQLRAPEAATKPAITISASLLAKATLLDSDGRSSFLQLATLAKRHVTFGVLNAAGEVLDGSGDFTTARPVEGRYEIKWTQEKPSPSYVVLTTAVNAGVLATTQIIERDAKHVLYQVNESAAKLVNSESAFIAIAT